MKIKVIINPDRKITQSVLYFQSRFMGWTKEDMKDQDDRYGSLPLAYVIAHERKEIVGVINLLKRKINFKIKTMLLGGIGGVCTHGDWRRQGIASRLLQKSLEVLKQQECDIALLCTDVNKLGKLYSQVGFAPLGRQYKATGLSGKIYLDDGGMIVPVNSQKLFNEVLNDKKTFDIQGQDW